MSSHHASSSDKRKRRQSENYRLVHSCGVHSFTSPKNAQPCVAEKHFSFNAFAPIFNFDFKPAPTNAKLNMKGRAKFYLKVVSMSLRRRADDDSLPFRASNSPFHSRTLRASLYYSINNQLRLIFSSYIAFRRS